MVTSTDAMAINAALRSALAAAHAQAELLRAAIAKAQADEYAAASLLGMPAEDLKRFSNVMEGQP